MQDVAERAAILVIADINGYTKFMLSHRKSLGHSQMIISDLLNSGVKSADTVLEVAKLEGDAVFLFAFKKTARCPGTPPGPISARGQPGYLMSSTEMLRNSAPTAFVIVPHATASIT